MHISEHYKLGRTQSSLDFVDVDIKGDTPIFIDPRALRLLPSPWGNECVALIQDFFKTVLDAIAGRHHRHAENLLRVMGEPNETHLGLSQGRARGRAIGRESAKDVWKALSKSEAAKSGLLEDLEDTILMVEGIASDIVSDIATNIIRAPLIDYTHRKAEFYGIPLMPDVDSGPLWNPARKEWYSTYVPLPMTLYGKLLLVPKVIVRRRMDYDTEEYYRHYLLEELYEAEMNSNTALVYLLRDGTKRVNKKDLIEKYGSGKGAIVRETLKHPEALEKYRRDKRHTVQPPLTHSDFVSTEGTPPPDWDNLLATVTAIEPGADASSRYEKAIEVLLSSLFYPSLTDPRVQTEIHDGRKRIDITYTNAATQGFFSWLATHYPAPQIFIECKNYSRDIANPELDQMGGRFSPSRGKFGIIICRRFENKETFILRCRDTANDVRGFIVPLDDADLETLVRERRNEQENVDFRLLHQRFLRLIN